ncbi:MAG TPA: J domain-containing protein [Candidatus Aphodovivens excrementavium]|nr:J domain-containing protein [Candidatus Aphodovivens excrementavium]
MNRSEALRILGLSSDASPDEIKAAYRETAQILHPDKFAGNKKLQERATEQFKNLQEAYDVLTKKASSARAGASSRSASSRSTNGFSGLDEEQEIEARLSGIAAARVQLAAQRDAFSDERRNGIGFLAVGGCLALICGRRPTGLFLAVCALASAAAIWGAVQVLSAQRSIATLDVRLAELRAEQNKLTERLAEIREG